MDRRIIPIIISGGGPVGLTLSSLLSRYGVRNVVLEKNVTLPDHPQVNVKCQSRSSSPPGWYPVCYGDYIKQPHHTPPSNVYTHYPSYSPRSYIQHTHTHPMQIGPLHQLSYNGDISSCFPTKALPRNPGDYPSFKILAPFRLPNSCLGRGGNRPGWPFWWKRSASFHLKT